MPRRECHPFPLYSPLWCTNICDMCELSPLNNPAKGALPSFRFCEYGNEGSEKSSNLPLGHPTQLGLRPDYKFRAVASLLPFAAVQQCWRNPEAVVMVFQGAASQAGLLFPCHWRRPGRKGSTKGGHEVDQGGEARGGGGVRYAGPRPPQPGGGKGRDEEGGGRLRPSFCLTSQVL